MPISLPKRDAADSSIKILLTNLHFFISGVVMLTVMVCCFLVFGVQKGDDNVLNSSRRRYEMTTDGFYFHFSYVHYLFSLARSHKKSKVLNRFAK